MTMLRVTCVLMAFMSFRRVHAIKDAILGYVPGTDVTDHLRIDKDQFKMKSILERMANKEGFSAAMDLYARGAHSKSYAELRVDGGYALNSTAAGTPLLGENMNGLPIMGLLLADAKAGDETVWVRYLHDGPEKFPCYVGGRQNPQFGGCLAETGSILVEGVSMSYQYDPRTDNRNGRTIRGFSSMASSHMKHDSGEFYSKFGTFMDYYNAVDYADKWIMAAFHGEETSFDRGNANFGVYDYPARSEAITTSTVTMSILMNVLHLLDKAVQDCYKGCPTNCPERLGDGLPVHFLDQAVAFYSGSREVGDVQDGVLLNRLANDLCRDFRTCGENSDKALADAYVNIRIFDEFQQMKANLMSSKEDDPFSGDINSSFDSLYKCAEANGNKERIADLMLVPLIQGTLRAAFRKKNKIGMTTLESEILEAQGASYAASVLPVVDRCDPDAGNVIYEQMHVGQSETDFAAVKEAFESTYACLKVDCRAVGGLWDAGSQQYFIGAEPCDQQVDGEFGLDDIPSARGGNIVKSGSSTNHGGSGSFTSLLAILVVLGMATVLFIRMGLPFPFLRTRRRRQPEVAVSPYIANIS